MKKFEFENENEYAEYILEQTNTYLDKCEIYGEAEDRMGLMTNIENSILAKSSLFKIFQNSPYHNGKGQLIIPMDVERAIDNDVIDDFAYYIKDIAKKYLLEEYKIDGYTFMEADKQCDELNRIIFGINYTRLPHEDVMIKGKPLGHYRVLLEKMKTIRHDIQCNSCYSGYDCYSTRESYEVYNKALTISKAVQHCVGKLLENKEDIERLAKNFPNSQCREGVKITRVVQKCLKELGLHKLAMENERETFNRKYAAWCDAVSPMTIKKWSVLSINFVDYLTMSNGTSWTSCLNTDKRGYFTEGKYRSGFNSRRTLDYALDETTMVFYTVSEDYDGSDWELQPKNTRQLFHFGEGKLIQSRLYPQNNVSRRNIYTQYRENVEKLLSEAMDEANLWSAPRRGLIDLDDGIVEVPYYYKAAANYIDFLTLAAHGDGEEDFQTEVNYVHLRGTNNDHESDYPVIIGSVDAVDIMDGHVLSESYDDSIAA